jgi:hypothetical protein
MRYLPSFSAGRSVARCLATSNGSHFPLADSNSIGPTASATFNAAAFSVALADVHESGTHGQPHVAGLLVDRVADVLDMIEEVAFVWRLLPVNLETS